MTAVPGSTTIFSGSYRSGSATSLATLDNVSYQVNAAYGQTAWYGRIYNVPNALRSLSVTYNGSNSLACSQTVAIWNWTYGYWVALDSRTVGAATTVSASVGGTLADYVSYSYGNGDVAVQVRCLGGDYYSPFYASGDLLRISYGT